MVDAVNSVFLGTSVQTGIATMIVASTGRDTAYGAIGERIAARPPETEFGRRTRRFGLMIMWVAKSSLAPLREAEIRMTKACTVLAEASNQVFLPEASELAVALKVKDPGSAFVFGVGMPGSVSRRATFLVSAAPR
jgi:hypothetical protein